MFEIEYRKIIDNNKKSINTNNNQNIKKCILTIGEVQSGKTAWIIEQINDELKKSNYNFIVYVGGNTKMLQEQTKNRVEKDVSDNIYMVEDKYFLNSKKIYNKYNNLLVCLHNYKYLHRLFDILKENNMQKILLFYDEGDWGAGNENSKIALELSKIWNIAKNILFYYVTATPFDNLNTIAYINDYQILYPKQTYCGLRQFDKYDEHVYEEIDEWNEKFCYETFNNVFEKIFDKWYEMSKELNTCQLLINLDKRIRQHEKLAHKIEKIITKKTKGIEIIILNGNNKKDDINKKNSKTIIIGEIMLSRGQTFENLNSEIIIASNIDKITIDVLMQKCRWLGHNKDIKKMKIFLNKKYHLGIKEAIDIINLMENLYSKKVPYLDFKTKVLNKINKCQYIKLR